MAPPWLKASVSGDSPPRTQVGLESDYNRLLPVVDLKKKSTFAGTLPCRDARPLAIFLGPSVGQAPLVGAEVLGPSVLTIIENH